MLNETVQQKDELIAKCPECKIIIDGNGLIGTVNAICQLTDYRGSKIPVDLLKQAGEAMFQADTILSAILLQMGLS